MLMHLNFWKLRKLSCERSVTFFYLISQALMGVGMLSQKGFLLIISLSLLPTGKLQIWTNNSFTEKTADKSPSFPFVGDFRSLATLSKSRKLQYYVCVCCQPHRSPAKQEIKLFLPWLVAQHTQCAPVQFTRPFLGSFLAFQVPQVTFYFQSFHVTFCYKTHFLLGKQFCYDEVLS